MPTEANPSQSAARLKTGPAMVRKMFMVCWGMNRSWAPITAVYGVIRKLTAMLTTRIMIRSFIFPSSAGVRELW